jgi:pimeloyl-ACP methyl ester carboxylesterase
MIVLCSLVGACAGSGAEGAGPVSVRGESAPRPGPDVDTVPDERDGMAGLPAGWEPAPPEWSACEVARRAECAEMRVPLDWEDPSGPTITLALARTRATGDRIGALLTNPGGPGGSGLEYLGHEPFGAGISARFDVVSWDPRGVGASTALSCGSDVAALHALDPAPDDDIEEQMLRDTATALAEECGTSDGDLLPHVGTEDVARDLEAIRIGLGDEPINYVGFSYGTQIGQVYAELFPERIRSMVLDAVVDPALGFEDFLLDQAVAFEESFDANATACARAGTGLCGVSDLAAAYDRVMDSVERSPLGSGRTQVGPSEVATGAILTSYGADGWELLGPALAAALEGEGDPLRSLADSYRDFGGFTSYIAVVCIDSPPPRGHDAYAAFAERAASAAPRFGAAVANELLPCATWPAAPVGEPGAIAAPGTPPILVVGNTGDAATPYQNAVAVAGRLESGFLVTAEIDGHVGYGANRCVTDHVEDYLIRLRLPPEDPRCT